MDGLVAGVDRAVVHRTLDEHPLELVPGAFSRDIAVCYARVTPDGAEAGVSWIQTLTEEIQQKVA